jgi:hypothetical protein
MLFLLISVIIIGALLTGTGALFGKLIGVTTVRNPWFYWWLGFFVISILAMFISLFVPINNICFIIFAGGIFGLPLWYRQFKQSIMQNPKGIFVFIFSSFLLIFIVICLSASSKWRGMYDTDLYHAQIIRWFNEYGTPKGLGNLHARLGISSLWLSFAAVLDNGFFDNRSAWLVPCIAWCGAVFYFLHELCFNRKTGVQFYVVCILVLLGKMFISTKRPSPSLLYDYPVHIINAIVVLEIWQFFNIFKKDYNDEQFSFLSCILILAASAFLIKPIGTVSLAFTGLITLFVLLRDKRRKFILWWIRMYIPVICALSIWIVRNIFLTGYMFYPLPVFAFPVDWLMTNADVESHYKAIKGWARMPGPDFLKSLENGFLFWFKPWIIRNLYSQEFIIAVSSSLLSLCFWSLAIIYAKNKLKVFFFFMWSILSILFWFLTAPNFRFGDGFFWVNLGLSLLCLISSEAVFDFPLIFKNKKLKYTVIYLWLLGIICGIGIAISPKRSILSIGKISSRPVKEYLVNVKEPYTIWIPADSSDDRTGNSPLPSAPYPVYNVEMRDINNLGMGFRPVKN